MGFKEWEGGYRGDDRKYFRVRRMVSFGKKSTVKNGFIGFGVVGF